MEQEVSSAWNLPGMSATERVTSGGHTPPRSTASTEPGLSHWGQEEVEDDSNSVCTSCLSKNPRLLLEARTLWGLWTSWPCYPTELLTTCILGTLKCPPLYYQEMHGIFCFPKHFVKGQHTVGVRQPSAVGMDMGTGSAGSLFCHLCQASSTWLGSPPCPLLQSRLPGTQNLSFLLFSSGEV